MKFSFNDEGDIVSVGRDCNRPFRNRTSIRSDNLLSGLRRHGAGGQIG
jgi:hypothetical protein